MNRRGRGRMTMKRFTMTVAGLGALALLWGAPASAAARCETRCANDKARADKVCKEHAKNGASMCMQATVKVKDQCLKSCREKATGQRERSGAGTTE